MSINQSTLLGHAPEVVFAFVRRLIKEYGSDKCDRRAQSREAIQIPIVVQPLGRDFQPTEDPFNAVTKNISTGGIGVVHSELIVARYLQVDVAAQDGEQMSLLAQVKHCTPEEDGFLIGARFVVDWSRWRNSLDSSSDEESNSEQ